LVQLLKRTALLLQVHSKATLLLAEQLIARNHWEHVVGLIGA
jgi:hypothetical protein